MLAGLIGNGVGLGIIGVCVIVMRHLSSGGGSSGAGKVAAGLRGGSSGGSSGGWKDWAMRVVIFLMFAGGTALTLVGIGDLVRRGLRAVLSLAGPNGAFWIGTLIALFLLLEVIAGTWKKPSRPVAWSAVFLAFAFTLVTTGPVGQIGNQLRDVGAQYSASFNAWMHGS